MAGISPSKSGARLHKDIACGPCLPDLFHHQHRLLQVILEGGVFVDLQLLVGKGIGLLDGVSIGLYFTQLYCS